MPRPVVRARVRHLLVEEQGVEVVGEVVVVRDRGPIAARLCSRPGGGPPTTAAAAAGRPRRDAPAARAPRAGRAHRRAIGPRLARSAHTRRKPSATSPSTSRSPATYARASPSSPGLHSRRRSARGSGARRRGRRRASLAAVPRPDPDGQVVADARRGRWRRAFGATRRGSCSCLFERRAGRRRGSRWRSRPRSTRGRSPTCGGTCASKPMASTSSACASKRSRQARSVRA